MAKKIVVLTGSPRKKGNSIAMTEAFIAAAQKKGHQITRFDTAQMPYQKSIALLKWTSIGEVLIPGVLAVGDIDKTDGCQQAAALADRI